MGVVQIMVITLSSDPDISYGDNVFGSKYQNDDGGPSYWWRDKLFSLIKKNHINNISESTLDILIDKFNKVDDLGLYRFEKFMDKLKLYEIDNADNIIEKFCAKEKILATFQRILLWFVPALQMAFVALSLKHFY